MTSGIPSRLLRLFRTRHLGGRLIGVTLTFLVVASIFSSAFILTTEEKALRDQLNSFGRSLSNASSIFF